MKLVLLSIASILAAQNTTPRQIKVAVLPTKIEESAQNKVPKLIDDYVLTAVQDLGMFKVIGQDDINAVLGFEESRDLLGCDDTSCFAAIGGALGVEKLVAIRVARINDEWATSAKLIHIAGEPTVEARCTHFVTGDASDLLRAVPTIVHKLVRSGPEEPPEVAQRNAHTEESSGDVDADAGDSNQPALPRARPQPVPQQSLPADSTATGVVFSASVGRAIESSNGLGTGYGLHGTVGYRLANGVSLDMMGGFARIAAAADVVDADALMFWSLLFGGRWDLSLADGFMRPFVSVHVGYSLGQMTEQDNATEAKGRTTTAGLGIDFVLGSFAVSPQLELFRQNSESALDISFLLIGVAIASYQH